MQERFDSFTVPVRCRSCGVSGKLTMEFVVPNSKPIFYSNNLSRHNDCPHELIPDIKESSDE